MSRSTAATSIPAPPEMPKLPAGWGYTPLSELVVSDRTITYGIVQPGQHTPGGVPIVRVNDIREGRINTDNPLRVSESVAGNYKRTRLRGGELLLTLVGTVGEAAVVPSGLQGWNTARAVAVIPVRREIGARWVHHCLRMRNLQFLIHTWCTTTVQATFNLRDAARLPIPMPPRSERESISQMLGTLDDKIELNRRMNETLERMARAIFKSWFVDFDPVRAKAEGRTPPGLDPATAALFPDSFEESKLGPIPKGWKVAAIGDIARYVNGRNFTKNATGTGRMVIRIAELNSGPGGSTVHNGVEADPVNTAYQDDILFAWSGSLDVYRWHDDEALINQHIFKVICETHPKWFVFHHLREAMPFFQGIASHKATTMGHIKRCHLGEAALAVPPDPLIKAVSRVMDPLYAQVHVLENQSRTLSAIRDALLPKLLSGEIRVGQAEKIVGEAGG